MRLCYSNPRKLIHTYVTLFLAEGFSDFPCIFSVLKSHYNMVMFVGLKFCWPCTSPLNLRTCVFLWFWKIFLLFFENCLSSIMSIFFPFGTPSSLMCPLCWWAFLSYFLSPYLLHCIPGKILTLMFQQLFFLHLCSFWNSVQQFWDF